MKSDRTQIIIVKCKRPPTVEIDTEASAAYVRFKRTKIARTLRQGSKWPIVTVDLDAQGEVVGVEFVGVRKFNLGYLLKQVPLKAPSHAIDRASYVSAEVHQVAA
jgi:uncharacterized protein YuzE